MRIAVTGVGIVSALGGDQVEFWSNAVRGRTGIAAAPPDAREWTPAPIAAVPARPRGGRPDGGGLPRTGRTEQFCLTAAREALAQAGLLPAASSGGLAEFGVSFGTTTAGMPEAERWYRTGLERGFARARLSDVAGAPHSVPTDLVAGALGASGPRLTIMSACASSALSIGHAADLLRAGDAPGMLAGGGDALCALTRTGFQALRLVDSRPCRPFDRARRGLTLGEGAGVLVLEPWESACARGAVPLAEFLDYGASCDAHHMTAPQPDGLGAAAAMREALARSGIAPGEIGHINAHGTGTALNDAAEARAITAVFGAAAARIPVTASKSLLGHALGGSGGLEAVTLVLSLLHQLVPVTAGWQEPDEALALDIVAAQPRRLACRYGLSNSFGFGGTNCALVFGAAR